MKYLALVLPLMCIQCTVPAHAVELVNGVVLLTPAEQEGMRTCAVMGGCSIVTGQALMQYSAAVKKYYFDLAVQIATQEIEAAKKTCGRSI